MLGDFAGLPTTDWSNAIGPDGSLPTRLGGVTAEISGKVCVIAYVSPDRVDLVLPEMLEMGFSALKLTTPDATVGYLIHVTPSSP